MATVWCLKQWYAPGSLLSLILLCVLPCDRHDLTIPMIADKKEMQSLLDGVRTQVLPSLLCKKFAPHCALKVCVCANWDRLAGPRRLPHPNQHLAPLSNLHGYCQLRVPLAVELFAAQAV